MLRNHRFEIVAQHLAAGKSALEASLAAGFDQGTSSRRIFLGNCRKRANRRDIRQRAAEI
jgi:hypothetical protein